MSATGRQRFRWLDAVLASKVPLAAKNVGAFLFLRASDRSECFPSLAAIANGCNLSSGGARAAVGVLRRLGFVERERGKGGVCVDGRNRTNLYRLVTAQHSAPDDGPENQDRAPRSGPENQDRAPGDCLGSGGPRALIRQDRAPARGGTTHGTTQWKNHDHGVATQRLPEKKQKPPGKLPHVRIEDLRDTRRLMVLLDEAAKRGAIKESEYGRFQFVSAAEHALRVGDNPPALFASLVCEANWRVITIDDEERARRRIKEFDHGGGDIFDEASNDGNGRAAEARIPVAASVR
jgi:hypothetical protein